MAPTSPPPHRRPPHRPPPSRVERVADAGGFGVEAGRRGVGPVVGLVDRVLSRKGGHLMRGLMGSSSGKQASRAGFVGIHIPFQEVLGPSKRT